MHCEPCETLLPLLVLDEIEDGDKAQVLEHLSQCAACTEKLGDLRVTLNLLRQGVAAQPAPVLSADRRTRLMAALSKEPRRSRRHRKNTPKSDSFRFFLTGTPARRLLTIAATLALSAALVGTLLPSLGSARRTARRMQNGTQARGIQQGLVLDSQQRGRYANDLADLVEGGYVTPEYLIAPEDGQRVQVPKDFQSWSRDKKSGWILENSSYAFVQPGGQDNNDSRQVVVFEKPRPGADGINIVYNDNHVEFKSIAEADKEVRESTGKSIEEWNESIAFSVKLNKARQDAMPSVPAIVNRSDDSFALRESDGEPFDGDYHRWQIRRQLAENDAKSLRGYGVDRSQDAASNRTSGGVAGGGSRGTQHWDYRNKSTGDRAPATRMALSDAPVPAADSLAAADHDADFGTNRFFNKPVLPPVVQSAQTGKGGESNYYSFKSGERDDKDGQSDATANDMTRGARLALVEPSDLPARYKQNRAESEERFGTPAKDGRSDTPSAKQPASSPTAPTGNASGPVPPPVVLATRTADDYAVRPPEATSPARPSTPVPESATPTPSTPRPASEPPLPMEPTPEPRVIAGITADKFVDGKPDSGLPAAKSESLAQKQQASRGGAQMIMEDEETRHPITPLDSTLSRIEGEKEKLRKLTEMREANLNELRRSEEHPQVKDLDRRIDQAQTEIKRLAALEKRIDELQPIKDQLRELDEAGEKGAGVLRITGDTRKSLEDAKSGIHDGKEIVTKGTAPGGSPAVAVDDLSLALGDLFKNPRDPANSDGEQGQASGGRGPTTLGRDISSGQAPSQPGQAGGQARFDDYAAGPVRLSVPEFTPAPEFDLNGALDNSKLGGKAAPTHGTTLFGKTKEPAKPGEEATVTGPATGQAEKNSAHTIVTSYDIRSLTEGVDVSADSLAVERLQAEEKRRVVIQSLNDALLESDEASAATVRELNGRLIVNATPQQHAIVLQRLEAAMSQNANADAVRGEEAGVDNAPLQPAASFRVVPVNPWTLAQEDAQSTFALDVDTASYTLGRRYIQQGYLPPQGSVRMEEYVNAFDYNYVNNSDDVFRIYADAAPAPFAAAGDADTKLVKIGVKGKVIGRDGRKPANLVFVVDTSGSMARADRLPLVQHSLELLVGQLSPHDTVSLVTFGSQVLTLLDRTPASNRQAINDAIRSLQSNGPTNLLKGVEAGYKLAATAHRSGAINRVILCSDGIATLGETEADTILQYVEKYRKQGISCTTVGVGAGAYDDDMMEKLANKGDGTYFFIDSQREARRVFVDEIAATLQTIAKDAKIQVEFNPQRVRRYRLVGYENRAVADKDFRNDTIDAGEVGSGQSSTALYEVELIGDETADLGTVYVRYRNTDTDKVEEIAQRLTAQLVQPRTPASDPRFFLAACAAEFAEILRDSEHAQGGSLPRVQALLEQVVPQLPLDEKAQELLMLVRKAQGLPKAP